MLLDVYHHSKARTHMRNEINTKNEWHTPKKNGEKSRNDVALRWKKKMKFKREKSKEKPEGFTVERFEWCLCVCDACLPTRYALEMVAYVRLLVNFEYIIWWSMLDHIFGDDSVYFSLSSSLRERESAYQIIWQS